jgi:hypothetical protein
MHMVGLQVSFQHSPLLLPESSNSCGPPAKPGVYPREIIKVLIENGYRVVDKDQLARIRYNEQVKEAARGNAHLASKIGNKYGADVIIVGEAFSESIGNVIPGGFITCRARIEARAVDTKTGEILAADGKYASGIDLGEFVAGKMAIQNAATELADYFVEYLNY